MVSKWLLFLRILSNALDPGTSREPMVRAFFHTLIVRAWVRRCARLLTLVKNIQTSGRFFEPLYVQELGEAVLKNSSTFIDGFAYL
jgi:hypothetical protein